ncbi:trypsin-like peptidase domain-containing protein [Histidinibacterium aquaticum]|nr:PDZ domain-containing protein [Histidinibacterium aquaticum]
MSYRCKNVGKKRLAMRAGIAAIAAMAMVTVGPATAQERTVEDSLLTAPVTSFAPIVAAVTPSVVRVATEPAGGMHQRLRPGDDSEVMDELMRRFGGTDGPQPPFEMPDILGMEDMADLARFGVAMEGAGFVVDPDGLIATSASLLGAPGTTQVTLPDGRSFDAQVVGQDAQTDLALLRIDAGGPLPALDWAESGIVEAGDIILAFAAPDGVGTVVTHGIVSAVGEEESDGLSGEFLRIALPLGPEGPGGPVVGMDGRVIGILVGAGPDDGAAYALAADRAQELISELESAGQVMRGWLGVAVQPVSDGIASALGLESTEGALISDVATGSPAEQAGLLAGDVIVALDGNSIADPEALSERVAALAPGHAGQIAIIRAGEPMDVPVTLAGVPGTVPPAVEDGVLVEELGVTVRNIAPVDAAEPGFSNVQTGVVVTEVGNTAERTGLRQGDVIVGVGRDTISDMADLTARIAELSDDRESVLLGILRDGSRMFVAVPLRSE